MKPFTPILLASLVANLALATVVVQRVRSVNASVASSISNPASDQTAGKPPSSQSESPSNASARRAPLWAGLGTDSIDEAIARLRAAGCPPNELIAAISGMIDTKFQQSRQTLGIAHETRPYWKSYDLSAQPGAGQNPMSAFAENERLRRTYLLTPELFAADETSVVHYRSRFGVSDVEKLRQLAILESQRNERQMQESNLGSSKSGEDRYKFDQKRYEAEQKQQDDAIKAILTADEYAAYELRNGPISSTLRNRLDSFQPSEAEFLALHAIEKSLYAENRTQPITSEQAQALLTAREEKIKNALGEERAADYLALQKAGSDTLPRLLNRFQIPLVSLTAINAIREQTNTRAKSIRADASLTSDQRNAQLAALAAEAETNLGTIFNTPRSLDAYKDVKGEWLRALAPKPGGP